MREDQGRRQERRTNVPRIGRASHAVEARLNPAILGAAIAVDVIAVIAGQRDPFSISADFKAATSAGIEVVFWSALGARVAGGASETAIGAGKTSFLLIIEVGADIAGRRSWWIRVWLSWQALSQILIIALCALTNSVDPL